AELDRCLQRAMQELQSGLHLEDRPLARAALIEVNDKGPSTLLLVIHRLIVDDISWRILLEDAWSAYDQLTMRKDVQLPGNPTRLQLWAERITSLARSAEFDQEVRYWRALSQTNITRLTTDVPDNGGSEDIPGVVAVRLSADETRSLLEDVPTIYKCPISYVLLASLAYVITEWSGNSAVLIQIEGSARDLDL